MEQLGRGDLGVVGPAFGVVEGWVFGPAAQLAPVKAVFEACVLNGGFQRITAEVRRVAGKRRGAGVYQHFDFVAAQEFQKHIQRMIGMAEGIERGWNILFSAIHDCVILRLQEFVKAGAKIARRSADKAEGRAIISGKEVRRSCLRPGLNWRAWERRFSA